MEVQWLENGEDHLLLETLKNIWQNYQQATSDADAKQHWLQLFLYNFQFIRDEQIFQHEDVKSFFNPIPEEVCSFLLEQVYEIINKSLLDNKASADVAELLRQNHNFAQVILSAPSDCSRIVALRTFLTHQLGQHLLQFLLRTDIKLIASQKSLCNLCINLFPNCPWGESDTALVKAASIFAYIGNLNFYQKQNTTQTLNMKSVYAITKDRDEATAVDPLRQVESFKQSTKSSDEIAQILIELLTKCVNNECDSKLSEQSISVIALNFALDFLRAPNDNFGTSQNAQIIKCKLLRLIEQCFNNIFTNLENVKSIQFQCIFAKLAVALEQQILAHPPRESEDSIKFLYALNFIMFGVLHNLIAIYSSNTHLCSSRHNLYTLKFIDEHVVDVCVESLKQLVPHTTGGEAKILLTIVVKTLIKIIDNLRKYDRLSFTTGTDGIQSNTQQRPRRKQADVQQLHCRTPTLSCFFQGVLLSLLPGISSDLQEYTMRYLLRAGTCCCHYSLSTCGTCLQVALRVSANYQKCAYKFLYRKMLSAVFVRGRKEGATQGRRSAVGCVKCDAKLKSMEFHAGLLQQYRLAYKQLASEMGWDTPSLTLLLKHLKHISHLLTNDIAAGILAEIVLPIFRLHKAQIMQPKELPSVTQQEVRSFWRTSSEKTSPVHEQASSAASASLPNSPKHTNQSRSRLQLHIDAHAATPPAQAEFRSILHECLNIFVFYLSDIRLIKAFYNEENIQHLEDLLVEPELIRSICDLIKIGIDNLTFLGDNSQEQSVLSRRLITLQLNSSDCGAKLFTELLHRFAKCSKSARADFWLDESQSEDSTHAPRLYGNLKPLDILHIAALQWSLNYELLKTSQYFYNEFAKIYSIVVEEDADDKEQENEKPERKSLSVERSLQQLKHGDKTIIDILKLNYNALSSFLMLPRPKAASAGSPVATSAPTNEKPPPQQQHIFTLTPQTRALQAHKAIDCFSSSLESLLSSVATTNDYFTTPTATVGATQPYSSLGSSSTTSTAQTVFYDSDGPYEGDTYDKVTQFYVEAHNETFLQRLHQQDKAADGAVEAPLLLAESIVLFDIRNQSQPKSDHHPSQLLQSAAVLSDQKTQLGVAVNSNAGIIGKLFSMFGGLFFGGSQTSSVSDLKPEKEDQWDDEIDADLQCFYETNGDGKKLLLKLFEATMAICIKGYQNEEVEKMQKHLRKLKAIILCNASEHWQQHAEEQTRENAVIKALQTLLKIAELSNSLHEPAAVISNSNAGAVVADIGLLSPTPQRSRLRPNHNTQHPAGVSAYNSRLLPASLSTKSAVITPPTPQRPLSGESGDGDYFSTRTSIICQDSEIEFSENDNEDYYLTADEGYEADGEIPEVSDSETEAVAAELWNAFQPSSRYRTHVLHDGLCRLVVEILIELSQLCTRNPAGWSDSLAQLANRLFVIRDYLGGALFLLRGFAPVLECSDVRLKELQQSILELVVDLNTPEVFSTFFSILAAKHPPMEILVKYMSYICTSSLKKAQPSVELEFPVIIDGKCISTGDPAVSEHIDRIRNYHLHAQASTPFTRSPCIIPITHARLWNNDGFTISLWLQVKGSQMHKSSSQLTEEDARSSNEEYFKSHIASIGSNQAMLSIYVNNNMNLVFETCKPNAEIHSRAAQTGDETLEPTNHLPVINLPASPLDAKPTAKVSHIGPSAGASTSAQSNAPFRNALKQTKLVLLNSFSNMHLFNGHAEGESYYEVSLVDMKHIRLCKNKWTHLAFAVDMQPDSLDLNIFIDGLEQHNVSLPFRNLRTLTRTHTFQMLSVGEGVSTKTTNNTASNTESRSTLDSYPIRLGISNLMLFNCKINARDVIFNLTAMGPDFTELTQCQVGNWKPNYGYLNLCRMHSANFGNFTEAMKLLKKTRILTYTAQDPDLVMGYDASMELDNTTYGRPYGLILYGELLQNQLQTIQTSTTLCGGLSTLLYLFARVVEVTNHSATQSMALDLLLSVALSESQLYTEFMHNDYTSLIGHVIKTERCTKDTYLLQSIVNNACSQALIVKKADALQVNENTGATLVYPRLITFIIHRYSDWHRSGAEHSDVLDMLFLCILALTREKHPHRDFNMEQLNKAGLVRELLNLCKVYVIESPNPVYISKNAAQSFVDILSVFAGSPPTASLMDEIMKLLLLLHKPSECYITHDRSKFYFLLSPHPPAKEKSLAAANLSRVAAPFRRGLLRERPGVAVPTNADEDAGRAARINRLRRMHTRSSPYKRALHEFEDNLENVADCRKLNKNALRLLSPTEVSNWRSRFKRRASVNLPTSPRRSSSSSKLQKTTKGSLQLAASERISRKRLRLNSGSSMRSQPFSDSEKRKLSESSAHSLAASLPNFDYDELAFNDVFGSSSSQRRHKSLVKTDFYSSVGIMALQEGLLKVLKDFLYLLPDNTVEDVLKHYVKVEFLLVLANNSSCGVRSAIIRLLAALNKRLPTNELLACNKHFYPQHLANQFSIYPTDMCMFTACLEWVSGVHGNLDDILYGGTALRIRNRFGLNSLLAITTKTLNGQVDKAFQVLRKLYVTDIEEQQCLLEAGILQCCVKALYNLYVKPNPLHAKLENAILELLKTIGEKSLKSAGQINVIWDILNLLTFYQENQPMSLVKTFRAAQAQLQLSWFNMFFRKTNVPWSFKVKALPDCTLSHSETRTRLDMLIDRCVQFFTIFEANYMPSDMEIQLFELLVSYGISTNQRCNNFIAWGLQPSRPRELRAFIVDALWISCQDDFMPSIICDGKMIKSFLWLCLLEDLDEPLVNLERLCKHLGINENDSAWNLETELERIQSNRTSGKAKQKTLLEKTVYKFEGLALNCIESSMTTTRRVAELQNSERKILMNHMKDYDESLTYTKWLEILRRLTHEGAPWYSKDRCENSWELDDTEGPSRVHTRLRRCHLDIDKRFFMQEYRAPLLKADEMPTAPADDYSRPLDYLISSYDQQLNISLNSQILYNFPAKYLPVDGEIDGEIIVTDHKLYFMATYRCKYLYVTCDISSITEIWLKRYQHQEKAFEIFLDTNQSLFFSLQHQEDWKIMHDVFYDKIVTLPDQSKVLMVTQQWREGLLTNWEYLMTLNQFAGRTYNDLMQYPVFPWILSNYQSDVLDLREAANFRKLEKPIAVQNEDNEQHYVNNYTYMMTNMGSVILKPYHYSSHYSNSGTVLHFLVRVPPFTSYFLRYQDNNFDLPDRTFHALSTTWCLASRDSPTDVKELIPEFFCLPEMFENFERFNFGCRQNGERVEDVQLPTWCLRDPRLFVLIHRQALESELARNNLHNWIDLIFGYKQTGESAVEAINVFHPATYAVFLDSVISDPIERKAVETMVKTYGQMPRQLFKSAHLASKPLNYCLGNKEILSSVRGLRWGVYLGSPQLPKPSLGNIYKLPGAEYLVAFSNTNVVYGLPVKSCVMQGAEPDTFNVISWGYDDRIVRIQPLNKMHAKPKNLLHNSAFDDITACGSDPNSNQLWFGHRSGRLSVYKCTSVEAHNRTSKGRQSYVRGLRLSYNSAFRKITTKSSGMLSNTDADGDLSPSVMSASIAAASGADALLQRDSADLIWSGPTVLVRHTDEITCIRLSVEFKIAVTAGRDGIAVIWDLNNWSYVRIIDRPAEIHHSPITHIAISPTLGDIATVHTMPAWRSSENATSSSGDEQQTAVSNAPPATADECFEVTEENLDDFVNVSINPNGKSMLRLHTVNARYVQHLVHEERILGACYTYIKEGVGVNVIATAVEGGIVRLWSSWNLSFVSEIVTGISNIKSITYSTHQHLVVLTKDSHIQVWETEGLYGSSPKFPQIAYK